MILLPQECVKYTARNLQYRHKAHSVCMDDRVVLAYLCDSADRVFFSVISHFPASRHQRSRRRHMVRVNVMQGADKNLCDDF